MTLWNSSVKQNELISQICCNRNKYAQRAGSHLSSGPCKPLINRTRARHKAHGSLKSGGCAFARGRCHEMKGDALPDIEKGLLVPQAKSHVF